MFIKFKLVKRFIEVTLISIFLVTILCSFPPSSTEYHEIKIKDKKYYVRGSIGGIGGTFLYSIGRKKHKGWKVDLKNDISLWTHNLSPCYFQILNDTVYFYSADTLTIPKKMERFPIKQLKLDDVVDTTNLTLIHQYSKGW